ncbi:MAG TPA: hypothetical protein VFQ82_14640 [Stellaceae bacterium]|nr:hypothetical protein [Stellaceae bacterium]
MIYGIGPQACTAQHRERNLDRRRDLSGRLHGTLNSDPATDTLNVRVQLREEIDLDYGGNEQFGTVTFDIYDLKGNLVDHNQATVHATRITVKTDLKNLF